MDFVSWHTSNSTALYLGSSSCDHNSTSDLHVYTYYTVGSTVTILGIITNSVALWVLQGSAGALRKSGAFVFLFNQSLVDLLVNVSAVLMLTAVNVYKPYVRYGNLDALLFCKLIYSHYTSAVLLTISSYNLALYSLECMLSVTNPLLHKSLVSRRFQKRVVVLLWTFGSLWNIPFVLKLNGQWTSGICRYWNTEALLSSFARSAIMAIYLGAMYILPLMTMCASYTLISFHLRRRRRKSTLYQRFSVNNIKTIIRVMLAYTCCILPPMTIILAKVCYP